MEFTEQEYLLDVLGPDAEAVFAAVEQLSQAPYVEWACPNTAFRPKLSGQAVLPGAVADQTLRIASVGQDANSPGVFPNDEYFPQQWHLHNTGQSGGTPGADIRAPEAWEITTGDPNIVVAVVDSGVDSKHPDLINNLVPGYDFIENDDLPDPLAGHWGNAHGTACAGLAAAQGNNDIGVNGVAWDCKIMPIRIYGFRADGTIISATEAEEATAFRWAANHGADILSNSWMEGNSPAPILHSAIVDITKVGGMGRGGKGCLVLFAAGNDSGPIQWYPQKYPEVITVGGTDHNDVRCYYSNYGPELNIVVPSAPGYTWSEMTTTKGKGWLWTTDIAGPAGVSSQPDNPYPDVLDYVLSGGTSGACPIAAGVAALILSVEPNVTGDEVQHFLERSAKDLGDPGRDDYYGWGRVDARAALDMVLAKRADLNNDWKVDFSDFAVLARCWKTDDLRGDIGPVPRPDGVLDVQALALMSEYWLREIPELGLIAHWKVDETEGFIAHDSAGSHAAFVMSVNPLWRPTGGRIGGALEFDGIDDYVSTPFILDPAIGGFSVFAWVKGGGPEQAIISQAGGVNWLAAGTSQGKLMTELKAPGRYGTPLFSEAVIIDGEWHRVGLTWDGSTRTLFVDNVEVAKGTQGTLASSQGGLYLGAGSAGRGEPGSFWSGLIDDIKIYDRAMVP
jgi:subtilisin family serine protease